MLDSLIAERAKEEDLAQILELQKTAYQSEAEICGDYNIPPLTQTLEGMKEDYKNQVILKIAYEGRIIGSVRAYERENVCHIGRVIVHPGYNGAFWEKTDTEVCNRDGDRWSPLQYRKYRLMACRFDDSGLTIE